ncbi:MAG: 6,7-dimethyl-8-ribityllumazine synthase [Solirubrobacteraceae bacterium]|nr:6,7-dimethyl-8-ribityllumazine synthase [Solirubrobacteraceae bacterium]
MTKVAIGVATFYTDLAERLETSATAALQAAGIEQIDRFEVPGAFELPVIAKYAADAGYDAVVLLGAVIRGQTSHYDHVCEEVARGIMEVQLTTGVPCGFGVLTVENNDQAIARSGGGKRDSGEHAVAAILALLKAKQALTRV